jgi:hypothetical protein
MGEAIDLIKSRSEFVYVAYKDDDDKTLVVYCRRDANLLRSDVSDVTALNQFAGGEKESFDPIVCINLNDQVSSKRKSMAAKKRIELQAPETIQSLGRVYPTEEIMNDPNVEVLPRDYIMQANLINL